ncbi:hypothetical protein POTOM_029546 [Populus tomentosa]|uniref:Uncharacterized protein n=1 Tax=Populus tomentosa TaxID=118781 RepID=A0A8X8CJS0_POPTO|nr:hypothetical protein POTOM_029546 [Populus tomentosa]
MENSSLILDGQKRVPLGLVVSDCAKRWFQDTLKEAKTGDITMQVLVGQMYFNGYGVPKDVEKISEELLLRISCIKQNGNGFKFIWSKDKILPSAVGIHIANCFVLPPNLFGCEFSILNDLHKLMFKGSDWMSRASKRRMSVWKVSDKRPGYNASDSDSDEVEDGRN